MVTTGCLVLTISVARLESGSGIKVGSRSGLGDLPVKEGMIEVLHESAELPVMVGEDCVRDPGVKLILLYLEVQTKPPVTIPCFMLE